MYECKLYFFKTPKTIKLLNFKLKFIKNYIKKSPKYLNLKYLIGINKI
jgi:hypothetical protein